MRLTEKQAMLYMKNNEMEISGRTWRRDKKKINDVKLDRIYEIAQYGFEDQHLERIDKCELIEQMMWQQFAFETRPYQRTLILEKIVKMQPYLSAYYEATKKVIEKGIVDVPKDPSVSSDGSGDTRDPTEGTQS